MIEADRDRQSGPVPASLVGGAKRRNPHAHRHARPAHERQSRLGGLNVVVDGRHGAERESRLQKRIDQATARPSFIETQFPVSRLSKESYKETRCEERSNT